MASSSMTTSPKVLRTAAIALNWRAAMSLLALAHRNVSSRRQSHIEHRTSSGAGRNDGAHDAAVWGLERRLGARSETRRYSNPQVARRDGLRAGSRVALPPWSKLDLVVARRAGRRASSPHPHLRSGHWSGAVSVLRVAAAARVVSGPRRCP